MLLNGLPTKSKDVLKTWFSRAIFSPLPPFNVNMFFLFCHGDFRWWRPHEDTEHHRLGSFDETTASLEDILHFGINYFWDRKRNEIWINWFIHHMNENNIPIDMERVQGFGRSSVAVSHPHAVQWIVVFAGLMAVAIMNEHGLSWPKIVIRIFQILFLGFIFCCWTIGPFTMMKY